MHETTRSQFLLAGSVASITEWLYALLFLCKIRRTSHFEIGGYDGLPTLISDSHIFLQVRKYIFRFQPIVVECLHY